MLINVDELSRLRHSHVSGYQVRPTDADLNYFIGLKDPLQTCLVVEAEERRHQQLTKTSSRRGSDDYDNELIGEMAFDRTLSEEDDDLFDPESFALYAFVLELVLFLRWCAGMCFIYPGSLKPI